MNERVALYWASLYDLSKEEGCMEDVYLSLKSVEKAVGENKEYIELLSSAAISAEEREALVEKAFSAHVHVFVLNFMKILAKRRIFDILLPCIEAFNKQYFKDNNIEHAKIVTAFELDEKKRGEIVDRLNKNTGKTIVAEFEVRPEIVGGIIIETESSSIDASVSGKLESIKRFISKN